MDPASGMEKIWIRDPGEPLIIIFNLSFITGDELLRAPLQAARLPGAAGHAPQPVQVQVRHQGKFFNTTGGTPTRSGRTCFSASTSSGQSAQVYFFNTTGATPTRSVRTCSSASTSSGQPQFNFSTLQAALLPGASGHAPQPVQVQVSLSLIFQHYRRHSYQERQDMLLSQYKFRSASGLIFQHYRRHSYQERQDMLLSQYKFRSASGFIFQHEGSVGDL